MGHIRLGRLPTTKRWQQVVALLSEGASVDHIAGASAEAAEYSLEQARNDPAVQHSFWLLTQVPLAARTPDFAKSLERLGLKVGASLSLFDVVGAFAEAVDRQSEKAGGELISAKWPSTRQLKV
jgi:uroporphyrinogen-III synthase